jgi:L-iditol 2-dehydrogenase
MAFHHVPCGDCYYCRKNTFAQCPSYKSVGCTAGFEPSGGGFAEYVQVKDWIVRRGLIKLPSNLPFEQAAFIEPLNTTYKGVRALRLEPDETVLVIGQGPIGILLATLARRTGAKVVTSDLYPQRHAVARTYGLEHPIDASTENVVARVRELSEGRGADAVMLAVGGNALIRTAIDAARPGGRIMLFAQTQHGDASFDPAVICMDEKTLMGSYSSSAAIQDEGVRIVLDGYTQGYDLTRLISHRFPLSRAAEAIAFASEPHPDSMKIMIEPGN